MTVYSCVMRRLRVPRIFALYAYHVVTQRSRAKRVTMLRLASNPRRVERLLRYHKVTTPPEKRAAMAKAMLGRIMIDLLTAALQPPPQHFGNRIATGPANSSYTKEEHDSYGDSRPLIHTLPLPDRDFDTEREDKDREPEDVPAWKISQETNVLKAFRRKYREVSDHDDAPIGDDHDDSSDDDDGGAEVATPKPPAERQVLPDDDGEVELDVKEAEQPWMVVLQRHSSSDGGWEGAVTIADLDPNATAEAIKIYGARLQGALRVLVDTAEDAHHQEAPTAEVEVGLHVVHEYSY